MLLVHHPPPCDALGQSPCSMFVGAIRFRDARLDRSWNNVRIAVIQLLIQCFSFPLAHALPLLLKLHVRRIDQDLSLKVKQQAKARNQRLQ